MNDDIKKVLVVDDDENLRLVLGDQLKLAGFSVSEAKDGEEGLKKALEEHPDVILLDVMMPIMNGLDVLSALRKDEWGKDARVIMLTVLENAETVAEAMKGGSFTYLIKTDLDTDEVVMKVRQILAE